MKLSRIKKGILLFIICCGILFYFILPSPLFNDPYCLVVNDAEGELLSASIAEDGQWRFPAIDSIPKEMEQCLLYFEDEHFYYHLGINPVSTFRALIQNIKAGKVVSGGSTISMQVIRMSAKNKNRSYWQKIKEMVMAFRMELSYSKEEILKLYFSHAPYGGNVVGAETASWRYFNRPLERLSWSEYATLAVLPNAPSLIMPGKNNDKLKQKRDHLLLKLYENNELDSMTYSLAIMEELPSKPHPLPSNAYHLLSRVSKSFTKGCRIQTTVDATLQKRVSRQVNNYLKKLKENKVFNGCALVVDLDKGEVKAYVGNASYPGVPAAFVDLIQANRSSGSILKPFLYAAALEEGMIHTSTLMRDVPTLIKGFSPTNFNKDYEGMVRAQYALPRSLNVPATLLLRDYGVARFYEKLNELGFSTLHRSANNYGLSLILGGAEVTLWEVAQVYSNQARKLNAYQKDNKKLHTGIHILKEIADTNSTFTYDYGSWWQVSQTLREVQRPGIEESWRRYSSSRKIAWKTGTSFGFRDAWAVGYDADYLVAIWVGNATGEGRPGLTGASTAAPLMFDIFQNLTKKAWFEKPEMDLKFVTLCEESGLAPNPYCPVQEVEAVMKSKMPALCNLHIPVVINEEGYRVFKKCSGSKNTRDTNWFIVDPIASYYYKQKHPEYRSPPPFSKECKNDDPNSIAIVYPTNRSEVIIPKDFDGTYEMLLAEAVHTNPSARLFWHLDKEYLGTTSGSHKFTLQLDPGKHLLSVLDENGSMAKVQFVAH